MSGTRVGGEGGEAGNRDPPAAFPRGRGPAAPGGAERRSDRPGLKVQ